MSELATIADFKAGLPSEAKGLVDSIGWNHSPEEERKRVEYLSTLFEMVAAGEPLSLEDSSRLILNAMTVVRDNARMKKKLDEMVLECLKSTVNRLSFRA